MEGKALSGEDSGEDVAALSGESVAVGLIDFFDEAVSAQHTQEPGDAGGARTFFFWSRGFGIEEKSLDIAVSESVDSELAAVDDFKELSVFLGPGAESADALAIVVSGLTNFPDHHAQGNRRINRSEGIEVAVVGGLRDVSAALKIGDAFAHGEPLFRAFGIAFSAAKDFEFGGLVDGGFGAQDAALLVVKLDGVLSEAMFDANAFGPVLEIADDFAFEGAVDFAAQEAHDVGAGKGRNAVKDQRWINLRQRGAVFEHDVGGPLALVGGPVVVERKAFEHHGMSGIETPGEFVQSGGPGKAELPVHESLSLFDVGELNKTIVAAAIRQMQFVHGASEPFAAVDAELNGEREPGLNTSVHKTKDRIDHVVIKSEPFAQAGHQFQPFGVAVAINLEAGARFDAGENGNEAFGDSVFLGDLQRHLFFVGLAGGKIRDGASLFFGAAQRGFFQLFGEALRVRAEFFEENILSPEQTFKSLDVSDGAESSAQDQSVESTQNPSDLIGMLCYKLLHGVLLFKEKFLEKPFYLLSDAVSISTNWFGCGEAAL